jgi:hypothetical protein
MTHNAAPDLDDLDHQYHAEATELQLVFNPQDPLPTAKRFVGLFYHCEGERTLHYHRGAA